MNDEECFSAAAPDMKTAGIYTGCIWQMAEVDVNRTHQGRDTPPIGFEDRAPHQRTNYLQKRLAEGFYVEHFDSAIKK
ncbi:MAG: hypothetical protein C0622_11665 [Desulfuromonas sp.]|nr:MAG: hypothetical protein C0622_11665 [Desulfuromonas sp.]